MHVTPHFPVIGVIHIYTRGNCFGEKLSKMRRKLALLVEGPLEFDHRHKSWLSIERMEFDADVGDSCKHASRKARTVL